MHASHLPALLKNLNSVYSAVVGITLTCFILLFLMTFLAAAAGYWFVCKSDTIKKDLTVISVCNCIREEVTNY